MCGRYERRGDKQAIAEAFQVKNSLEGVDFSETYDAAPGSEQPVLYLNDAGERSLAIMRWGFKLPDRLLFNARSEGVTEAKFWKDKFAEHRCIVPASMKCATAGANNGNYKASTKTVYQRKLEAIAKHRKKHLCRRKLENAIRAGKVKRQPCFSCGKMMVEAHHWDYSKPLDVFWLCRLHHVDAHNGKLTLPLPSRPVIPPRRWGA
jgi:SOS response associated peptidase (SRAP)